MIILYVRIFVVDPVVKFFLLIFYFFFLFEVFLVLVCLIFEGLYFAVELFCIFCVISVLILFYLWVILNDV